MDGNLNKWATFRQIFMFSRFNKMVEIIVNTQKKGGNTVYLANVLTRDLSHAKSNYSYKLLCNSVVFVLIFRQRRIY